MIHKNDMRRTVFAETCALVLPAWEHMPAADALGLEHLQLDTVCRVRPDVEADLLRILGDLSSPVRHHDLDKLKHHSPEDLQTLTTAVCGAYYLHPTVRKLLGYQGQEALSLPRAGFGAEELVMKMMAQPKRYRSHPTSVAKYNADSK